MKYFGCFVLNSCQPYGKDYFYEPLQTFRWGRSLLTSGDEGFPFSQAATKQEFCNLTQLDFRTPGRNETLQTAFYEQCMKGDHPNVLICPQQPEAVLRIPNADVEHDVKILRNKLKEIKSPKKLARNQKMKKRKRCKSRKKCNRKWKRKKLRRRRLKLKKRKAKKRKQKKKKKKKNRKIKQAKKYAKVWIIFLEWDLLILIDRK